MKCDESKLSLMDFLYDEISAEDKAVLLDHLSKCTLCREEYQSLKATSTALRQVEAVEPNLNLVFVSETKSIWSGLKDKFSFSPRKIGYAFAFGFVTVLLLFSIMNTEIFYEHGKFSMKMSLLPRKAEAPQQNVFDQEARLVQLQQQNIQYMNTLLSQSEERQRQELMAALRQFSRDFENRRSHDLRLVGAGLDEIEQTIYSRLERRTNHQLNNLIRYIDAKQVEDR